MAMRLIGNFGLRIYQDATPLLAPSTVAVNIQFVREKHWNPKFKRLRGLKIMKVDLPNFREKPDDLSEEQIRSKLKEHGLLPPRPWIETPYYISSTGGVFEPYVPPEGDGKISPIHMQGAKQKLQFLEKKSKTMMAIRKIRSYEEEFETENFCKEAENIYIKMHESLAKNDKDELIKYVTERAFPEVLHNTENKTVRWKFIKNIELPAIVQARCTDVVSKENIFGQITMRFHTQQTLAIYDRFGRLMHGSEIIAKDVLEYVVFEKHVSNFYGLWRIHGKIIPDWLPPREPSRFTYVKIQEAAAPAEEVALVETPEAKDVKSEVKKE